MEAIVRKPINRKQPDGTIVPLAPGDRITLEWSEAAKRLFKEGVLEAVPTSTDGLGRQKSLEMCMDATMFEAMREIQEIGHFESTPAVLEIEEEIHRIYVAVLAGLQMLADYRKAVELWKEAVKAKH